MLNLKIRERMQELSTTQIDSIKNIYDTISVLGKIIEKMENVDQKLQLMEEIIRMTNELSNLLDAQIEFLHISTDIIKKRG